MWFNRSMYFNTKLFALQKFFGTKDFTSGLKMYTLPTATTLFPPSYFAPEYTLLLMSFSKMFVNCFHLKAQYLLFRNLFMVLKAWRE